MSYIKDRLHETSTWVGLASILASLIMIFTPDNIDAVIERLLPYIKEIIETFGVLWGGYKIAKPETN